jgi:hypothetical protein
VGWTSKRRFDAGFGLSLLGEQKIGEDFVQTLEKNLASCTCNAILKCVVSRLNCQKNAGAFSLRVSARGLLRASQEMDEVTAVQRSEVSETARRPFTVAVLQDRYQTSFNIPKASRLFASCERERLVASVARDG